VLFRSFAKDVQAWFASATIKCAQFYGTKIQKPIASQQIYGGNVFEMVDMAVSFVMSRINQHVGERTQNAQVDVTPELPPQAVAEAIVNAVVHRNYNDSGSVQVMLFKDRLEIWNPGRLPHGMTIAKLNEEHTSRPVNPVLAHPVYLAGYIEQLGTGTTDIIESCLANGLRKPEFHQEDDFRIVLWRPKQTVEQEAANTTGKVASKVRGKVDFIVDKKIARIIMAIRGNTVSTRELMAVMKLKGGDNFRKRYLYPSIEAGYVSKLYPDSESRPDQAYYLTEKGLQLLNEIEQEKK
jgi:predicted HTH transcriptional regulator